MPSLLTLLSLLIVAFPIVAVPTTWVMKRWADRYESASRLGLFRIAYSCVLLCEILQVLYCEPLIYDRQPGAIDNNMPIDVVLYVWCLNTVLLGIGYRTRFVTITNFAFGLMVFSVSRMFEYHVDYAYTGINFLLLFAPVSHAWSVDARRRRQDSIPSKQVLIPAIYSQLIVLFGIGVVYADSCLWKFWSHNWTHGIGFFAYASHPAFAWIDLSPILDVKLVALTSGYLTLAFELLFVPLMWFYRPRYLLSVIGIILHLGILLVFPIPWFGLCMTALYILVWPPKYTDKPQKKPQPLSDTDSAFGRLTLPQLRWVVTFLLVLQFNASILGNLRRLSGSLLNAETADNVEQASHSLTDTFSRPLFGIVTHPVFMDTHLELSQQQYQIRATNKWTEDEWLVPVTTEHGLAHPLNSGRLWVNWMFRVAPYFETGVTNREHLYRRLQFCTLREGRLLDGTTFRIEARSLPVEKQWQPNLLSKRRAIPWRHVADVTWQNGNPVWQNASAADNSGSEDKPAEPGAGTHQ